MLYFIFATPKRHILGQNGVFFWRILRQNPSRALGCSELQEPPPQKTEKLTRFWCAKSRMRGDETPGRIVTNLCTGVGVHDVITCDDLYYDRLRGLGVAGGQILAFSIDLLRRPYNTLARCECVITQPARWYSFYRPTEGRRMSRLSWLVTYRDDLPIHRWSPILVSSSAKISVMNNCHY